MKSEIAFFKDKRWRDFVQFCQLIRFLGFTDDEIIAEVRKIMAAINTEPSPSDVSVTPDVLTDIKTGRSVENTNPDYYKDELYLDEDFRTLAKTYPADVSAIGVTTLIDYVEAVEAELARLKDENHALDQINRDIQTASSHLDEVLAELASRDEIIARLKEDAERLVDIADMFGDDAIAVLKHRALMKELE